MINKFKVAMLKAKYKKRQSGKEGVNDLSVCADELARRPNKSGSDEVKANRTEEIKCIIESINIIFDNTRYTKVFIHTYITSYQQMVQYLENELLLEMPLIIVNRLYTVTKETKPKRVMLDTKAYYSYGTTFIDTNEFSVGLTHTYISGVEGWGNENDLHQDDVGSVISKLLHVVQLLKITPASTALKELQTIYVNALKPHTNFEKYKEYMNRIESRMETKTSIVNCKLDTLDAAINQFRAFNRCMTDEPIIGTSQQTTLKHREFSIASEVIPKSMRY